MLIDQCRNRCRMRVRQVVIGAVENLEAGVRQVACQLLADSDRADGIGIAAQQ